jgi:hypothetical protein
MTDDVVLNGKCCTMDGPTRTFRMKDIDGSEHPFKWTEPLDVVMMKNGEARWKPGFYLTVTYNSDTHTVKNVTYWNEGKDKFPKDQKGSGSGRPYSPPRNEKAIMFECALKCMTELYVGGLGGTVNGKGFDTVADSIIAKAVAATEAGIKVAGVQ